ncbi:hypothetical protein PLEOSDRAFT_171759 [Pleurotus ostreatus PC15]|uniref:Mug135-like C-terminal domain-containing protein n=1 Tax=Pleurotus ostreatus (strain PC15) TaxID=1137138 RepID=A0A067NF47_PLEO1|nr:hypothetical protein PLEOSDRAFT_171759 [Pleurotus ostreatus PC15]
MIQLPVLSASGHQVLDRIFPPPPSDPPVTADVAKAWFLAYETARLYVLSQYGNVEHHTGGPFITHEDLCNTAVYASQIIGTRTVQLDLVAALREAIAPVEARLHADMQSLRADMQGLRADMQQVREDLGKESKCSRRLAAIARNSNSPSGAFESVPFANFDDPVTAPHNLPSLHSLDAVNGLEDEPLRAYVSGYYPGTEAANIARAQCINLVLAAIGAFKHTRV